MDKKRQYLCRTLEYFLKIYIEDLKSANNMQDSLLDTNRRSIEF